MAGEQAGEQVPGKGEGLQRDHWGGKNFCFEEGGVASRKQNYEVEFNCQCSNFFLLKSAVTKVVCGIIVSSVKGTCCSAWQQEKKEFHFLVVSGWQFE